MLYHSIYPQVTPSPTKNQSHPKGKTQNIRFPEDVQIILRSDRNNYGNLYIGNLESA